MEHGKAASVDRPDWPVITTARLLLRRHETGDIDARLAMGGDPEVTRHIGGVQTPEDSWHRIQRNAGQWALHGWGLFLVEERDGGAFLGECGLSRFERGIGPGFDDAPEAAWAFARAAQGRGLAAEAMRAALDWYASRLDVSRTVCLISAENAASLRLAAALDYRAFGEAVYRDRPAMLLERHAPFPKRSETG